LAKLFFKYGDIGPIRGILNGLRPAVVALICSAGVGFILLALWNTESLPKDYTKVDLIGCIVLPISLWCIRNKMSVIKLLCFSGILGLILGISGIR
jgi:chromate transporter